MSLSSVLLLPFILLISSQVSVVRTGPTLLASQSKPNSGRNSISHRNIQWEPIKSNNKADWQSSPPLKEPFKSPNRRNQSRTKASNLDGGDELTGGRGFVGDDGYVHERYRRKSPGDNSLSMPVVLLFMLIVAVCMAVVVIEVKYSLPEGLFRVLDQDDSSSEERYGGPRDKSKKSKRKRKHSKGGRKRNKRTDEDEDEDEDDSDDESRRRRKKHRKGHRRRKSSSSKKVDSSSGKATSDSKHKGKRSKRAKGAQDDSNST